MCECSENTFEEIPFLFPEKMIMVEYPSLLSPLPTPTPTHNLYFSSGLLSLPSGDTPYSSICPPRLVVGCLCKCRFLGSSQPSAWGILVADSRIFIFVKFFMGERFSCPQDLRTPAPVHLWLACYIRWNQHYAVFLLKCFVVEEQAASGPEQIVTM